ncbi:nucleotide-binding protein ExpZ [Paraliobacillus ryukyuensis]|uniref:Macrolide transport system ATP-binding/permease protein n=1 Tax=Paraliobacillus ryukyuensis TaxID=200904 RepID=A0A366EFT4_9BACI|nr:ABC-F type ribosomal protection protein [Paraliobacillus ryukyuensis]RBP00279.1 macrolide transport system ATP-binding/permease protein [Paraliobacillus ryukyuensis]
MKEIMQLQAITIEIEGKIIFEKATTHVQQGDVIGVIGKNGAGKSMLLHMLHGDFKPTDGQVNHVREDLNIRMVEQELTSYSSGEVTAEEATLLKEWHVPTLEFANMSGGEKLKARLAKGFTQAVDILLLDEPTNHLDQQSTDFLVNRIQQFKGTIILVSHDRYFLDQVATKIWAIENKQVISHLGNYTSYIAFREKERRQQQQAYDKQQKMKAQMEKQIKQLSSWSTSAHAQSTKQAGFKEYYRVKAKKMDAQVKSKQKRLEKELEKVNAEAPADDYQVNFTLTANDKVGKRLIEVRDLAKVYRERSLFKHVTFTVQHGEKVALKGPNGSGKTTLLQMITGHIEASSGEIWVSPSATIGYLTQNVFDLPLTQTPAQLFEQSTYQAQGHVRNLMRHLGFQASHYTEQIGKMSMGERVKLKLMTYMLEAKDILILDEPTNHLDLPSREQLESTLEQYNGTLLVVSHDRYFLDKTTNRALTFSKNTIVKQMDSRDQASIFDRNEEKRLTLETERQDVLGRLSFMTPGDAEYEALDRRFNELTKIIKELS